METKFDIETIQHINLFELTTSIRAIDCFEYGFFLMFVVRPKFLPQLLAKNCEKIHLLSRRLRRKVKIIVFPNDTDAGLEKFASNIISPVRFRRLSRNGEEVTIRAGSSQTKARLIGRDSVKLNALLDILRKYFKIKKIRIT